MVIFGTTNQRKHSVKTIFDIDYYYTFRLESTFRFAPSFWKDTSNDGANYSRS